MNEKRLTDHKVETVKVWMLFVTLIAVALAVSCNSNNGQFSCNGNDIAMKQSTEESRWQTPPCGADHRKATPA